MPKITIDQERCNGCGKCQKICPKGPRIYGIVEVNGKHKCVVTNSRFCLGCTTCIGSCPTGAVKIDFRTAES